MDAALSSNDVASSFIGVPFDLGRIDPSGAWNGRSSTLADLSGNEADDGPALAALTREAKAAAHVDASDGQASGDAASPSPVIDPPASSDGAKRMDSVTRDGFEWFRLCVP